VSPDAATGPFSSRFGPSRLAMLFVACASIAGPCLGLRCKLMWLTMPTGIELGGSLSIPPAKALRLPRGSPPASSQPKSVSLGQTPGPPAAFFADFARPGTCAPRSRRLLQSAKSRGEALRVTCFRRQPGLGTDNLGADRGAESSARQFPIRPSGPGHRQVGLISRAAQPISSRGRAFHRRAFTVSPSDRREFSNPGMADFQARPHHRRRASARSVRSTSPDYP